MNNTKSIYRTPLVSCMALITILICCAAFIGCPETQEMADDVIMSPGDTPPPPAEDEDEDKPPPPAEDEDEDKPPPPTEDEDEDKPPPPAG